ncbi:hypothetical protein BV22DRAFT_1014841 [Leucogyrophana mollusca]|uniref:Uncharacterized protein n=1 Tax=Leucogyrophana mollusca TaxID=85980 RepID=A0ACB8BFZ9_9AGAM|nr:hypothetical protein BV22DRAFT_1014841 [Leucogyrophana mollusca]
MVSTGTGAISILFHNYPYANDSTAMKALTMIFFFFNLGLFMLFTAISAARYILFPDIWPRMIRHPVQSLYLGTFPMGATTLINVAIGAIFQTYNFGGDTFVYFIWGVWWLDVAISFICCWGMMHVMFVPVTRQEHSLKSMTTAWLLPVVTLIVGSSSGGVLASALVEFSPSHALLTTVFSACMVTIGLSLSLMMLTIYILRLMIHGYPLGLSILSAFFPLGPCGQAGYSILLIGQSFKSILPLHYGDSAILRAQTTADSLYVLCTAISVALWAFATMWLLFALLGLQDAARHNRIPFKLSFWSMIFPNGVYANLTIQLYRTFDSHFFRVWGAIYGAATLVLWICIAVPTARLVPSGVIFDAPHFTWAWHTVIMGTGATSALVHSFPYGHGSLAIKAITLIMFFLNLLLFVVISSATIARYAMFPEVWSVMLQHPAQSLFIGAFPMGAATLINIALVANQEWGFGGTRFLYTLWGFWMIKQKHTLSKMAAVWLLPVVTLIVASSTGGLLSAELKSHSTTIALLTTGFSLTMVIIGLTLALMMITVYLARLILHGPPDADLILSAFVVLGPLGQGGFSLLEGNIPFSLAYWGLVFPNGVYALLSVQLGAVLNSGFFRVFGAIWSVIVFILWLSISIRTIPAVLDRSIFNAPYLAAVPSLLPFAQRQTDSNSSTTGSDGSQTPPLAKRE